MVFDVGAFLDDGVAVSTDQERVLVGWGEKTWSDEASRDKEHPWFYFPDFFLKDAKPGFTTASTAILTFEELDQHLQSIPSPPPPSIPWVLPEKQTFASAFGELTELFGKGELQKLVLYAQSKAQTQITKTERLHILKGLLSYKKQNNVYLYGFWNQEFGELGATPEILFRYRGKPTPKVETMALAGTMPSNVPSEELLNDAKLLHEHQIVIDEIAHSLKSFGKVEIGKTQVLKLWTLSHVYTPIEAELTKVRPFTDYVQALHPTPALGAFPKERGLRWLANFNKTAPRGRFGAPAGVLIDQYEGVCYVAIRNISWEKDEAIVAAGCGIIPQSIMDNEWQEILLKTNSIHKMIQL